MSVSVAAAYARDLLLVGGMAAWTAGRRFPPMVCHATAGASPSSRMPLAHTLRRLALSRWAGMLDKRRVTTRRPHLMRLHATGHGGHSACPPRLLCLRRHLARAAARLTRTPSHLTYGTSTTPGAIRGHTAAAPALTTRTHPRPCCLRAHALLRRAPACV